MREEIAALVRFHGRPAYLFEKRNPEHEVISLSWRVNNRLLYLFALADTRGRYTKEMSRPEEDLHPWKMLAEERGCFNGPYAFANDHARFLSTAINSAACIMCRMKTSLHRHAHVGIARCGQGYLACQAPSELAGGRLGCDPRRVGSAATDNQGEVIQAAREQCREHLRACAVLPSTPQTSHVKCASAGFSYLRATPRGSR